MWIFAILKHSSWVIDMNKVNGLCVLKVEIPIYFGFLTPLLTGLLLSRVDLWFVVVSLSLSPSSLSLSARHFIAVCSITNGFDNKMVLAAWQCNFLARQDTSPRPGYKGMGGSMKLKYKDNFRLLIHSNQLVISMLSCQLASSFVKLSDFSQPRFTRPTVV